MLEIRYVQLEDKGFWYSLDKHLPEQEFDSKVREKSRLDRPAVKTAYRRPY